MYVCVSRINIGQGHGFERDIGEVGEGGVEIM